MSGTGCFPGVLCNNYFRGEFVKQIGRRFKTLTPVLQPTWSRVRCFCAGLGRLNQKASGEVSTTFNKQPVHSRRSLFFSVYMLVQSIGQYQSNRAFDLYQSDPTIGLYQRLTCIQSDPTIDLYQSDPTIDVVLPLTCIKDCPLSK